MANAQFIPLGGLGGYGGMQTGLNSLLTATLARNADPGLRGFMGGQIAPQFDPANMFQAMVPLLLAREERPFREQEHADLLSLQREMMEKQFTMSGDERAHQLKMQDATIKASLEAAKLQTEPLMAQIGQAGVGQALTGLMALQQDKAARLSGSLHRGMLQQEISGRVRTARTQEAGDVLSDAEQRAMTDASAVNMMLDSLEPTKLDSDQASDAIMEIGKLIDAMRQKAELASSPEERYAATRALGSISTTTPAKFREIEDAIEGWGGGLVSRYGAFGTAPVENAFESLKQSLNASRSLYRSTDLPTLRREALSASRDVAGLQRETEELRLLLDQVGSGAGGLSNDAIMKALEEQLTRQLQSQGIR